MNLSARAGGNSLQAAAVCISLTNSVVMSDRDLFDSDDDDRNAVVLRTSCSSVSEDDSLSYREDDEQFEGFDIATR